LKNKFPKKEEQGMIKKSSVWLVVLIAVVAIAFIATGCAKKQVVKGEAEAKAEAEAKKEEAKVEAAPAPAAPKEEAKAEAEAAEKAKEEAAREAAAREAAAREAAAKEAAAREAAAKEAARAKEEAAAKAEEKPAPPCLTCLRLQFAFDDYNLSNKSKENLEKIASWMSKDAAAKVQIEGHTCDIGTAEYNLALGERRANSAKKYLEGLGVSSARISTISYGEERPLVPNSDEGNRSKNRRDEFVQSK
jgi:peptidoglycan-associated lipoprotein